MKDRCGHGHICCDLPRQYHSHTVRPQLCGDCFRQLLRRIIPRRSNTMGHKPWDREAKRAEKAERKRQWKADIEALGELQVAEDENEARDDG